jgi:hypothetical protein
MYLVSELYGVESRDERQVRPAVRTACWYLMRFYQLLRFLYEVKGKLCAAKLKGLGTRQLWPVIRYCLGISVEVMGKSPIDVSENSRQV